MSDKSLLLKEYICILKIFITDKSFKEKFEIKIRPLKFILKQRKITVLDSYDLKNELVYNE